MTPSIPPARQATAVIDQLRREDLSGNTDTFAFVVMPDHFHWLITLTGSRPLSVSVNTVKSWSTRRINELAGSTGRLWSPGFFDRAIRKEEDLGAIARYIVANPLRAGLVRSIRDYPHWDAKWL